MTYHFNNHGQRGHYNDQYRNNKHQPMQTPPYQQQGYYQQQPQYQPQYQQPQQPQHNFQQRYQRQPIQQQNHRPPPKSTNPFVNVENSSMIKIGDYKYDPKNVLGKGQFGTVYKGHSLKTGEEVAIKVLRNDNPQVLAREVNILKDLEGSPNILRYFAHYGDIHKKYDMVYIVTEVCSGGDLEEFLKKNKSISHAQIKKFLKDIARGLQSVYRKGYVHRDIKPANMLLTKNHELKFSDFGLARDMRSSFLAASYCGTPFYMAPEVLSKKQYDANVDLYSVGIILYQMIYGKYPHRANDIHSLTRMANENPIYYPRNENLTDDMLEVLQILLERNSKARAFQAFFEHPLINLPQEEPAMKPISIDHQSDKTAVPASETNLMWDFFDRLLSSEPFQYDYPSYVVNFNKVKFHGTNHGQDQYATLLRSRCETYWYLIECAALLLQGGSVDASFSVLVFAGGRILQEIHNMDATLERIRLVDSEHMKNIRRWCLSLLKNLDSVSKRLSSNLSALEAVPAPVPQLAEFTVKLASYYSTQLQLEVSSSQTVKSIFRRVCMILRFLSESPYNTPKDQQICKTLLAAVVPLQQRMYLSAQSF